MWWKTIRCLSLWFRCLNDLPTKHIWFANGIVDALWALSSQNWVNWLNSSPMLPPVRKALPSSLHTLVSDRNLVTWTELESNKLAVRSILQVERHEKQNTVFHWYVVCSGKSTRELFKETGRHCTYRSLLQWSHTENGSDAAGWREKRCFVFYRSKGRYTCHFSSEIFPCHMNWEHCHCSCPSLSSPGLLFGSKQCRWKRHQTQDPYAMHKHVSCWRRKAQLAICLHFFSHGEEGLQMGWGLRHRLQSCLWGQKGTCQRWGTIAVWNSSKV